MHGWVSIFFHFFRSLSPLLPHHISNNKTHLSMCPHQYYSPYCPCDTHSGYPFYLLLNIFNFLTTSTSTQLFQQSRTPFSSLPFSSHNYLLLFYPYLGTLTTPLTFTCSAHGRSVKETLCVAQKSGKKTFLLHCG